MLDPVQNPYLLFEEVNGLRGLKGGGQAAKVASQQRLLHLLIVLEVLQSFHAGDTPVSKLVGFYPTGLNCLAVQKYDDELIVILRDRGGQAGAGGRCDSRFYSVNTLGP